MPTITREQNKSTVNILENIICMFLCATETLPMDIDRMLLPRPQSRATLPSEPLLVTGVEENTLQLLLHP
ncbi:hypothetical protein EYF80_037119 [Liparis tanakae]|uniref:Uncharacterized protein n=1 Tax=Liparis tanakae TaxID=230148 RepID=A0A4Z2GGJ3_9TELE|nr:hypothetical protein EYF80_037119 [Liparis tanakae]